MSGFLFGFVLLFNFCQLCQEQSPHRIDGSPGVWGMCLLVYFFFFSDFILFYFMSSVFDATTVTRWT